MWWVGREARQRPAKPYTRVRIPYPPRAIGAGVARFLHTEEVTGSIPVSPTSKSDLLVRLFCLSNSRRMSAGVFSSSPVDGVGVGHRTLRVAGRVTFRRRWCGHRTQRGAGPFGVSPLSSPGRHGDRREACEPFRSIFCFCERILRTWAPLMRTLTREVVVWAACPPCHQWGLAAHQRVKGASRQAHLAGPQHNKLARRYPTTAGPRKTRPARPLQPHFRENTCPARHQTPILGHCEHTGRTFSRPHPHHAGQGEKYRARGATTWRFHPHALTRE